MKIKTIQRLISVLLLILIAMIVTGFSLNLVELLGVEWQYPFYDFFWRLTNRHDTLFWIFYWGVALAIGFTLLILLKKGFFEKKLNIVGKKPEVNNEEITENWKEDDIMNCRIELQKSFISRSNAQGVRLLALIAGQWVFLQTFEPLDRVTPLLLLMGIVTPVFLFFIVRSFFRFSVFSAFSSHVRWIEKPELRQLLRTDKTLKGKNLLVLTEFATAKKITGDLKDLDSSYTRQKIIGIPYDWFMDDNSWRGFVLSGFIACLSTIILLVIIW